MKKILACAVATMIAVTCFSQREGHIVHTWTKLYYVDEGRKGFSFENAPIGTLHSYNLVLYNKSVRVLECGADGKITADNPQPAIESLVNVIGNQYDQLHNLQERYNSLYQMMLLVKDGKVTDKNKWNKSLADFTKLIQSK